MKESHHIEDENNLILIFDFFYILKRIFGAFCKQLFSH